MQVLTFPPFFFNIKEDVKQKEQISNNDILIYELLNDSRFVIYPDGRIWRKHKCGTFNQVGRVNNRKGYLSLKYKRKQLFVHRIVYAKFGPKRLSADLVVNHIDYNTKNNNIANLELVSVSQNTLHGGLDENGKIIKIVPKTLGQTIIGNKKLSFEIAEEIRLKKQNGDKQKDLAKYYKVSVGTISEIVNNKIWTKEIHG